MQNQFPRRPLPPSPFLRSCPHPSLSLSYATCFSCCATCAISFLFRDGDRRGGGSWKYQSIDIRLRLMQTARWRRASKRGNGPQIRTHREFRPSTRAISTLASCSLSSLSLFPPLVVFSQDISTETSRSTRRCVRDNRMTSRHRGLARSQRGQLRPRLHQRGNILCSYPRGVSSVGVLAMGEQRKRTRRRFSSRAAATLRTIFFIRAISNFFTTGD